MVRLTPGSSAITAYKAPETIIGPNPVLTTMDGDKKHTVFESGQTRKLAFAFNHITKFTPGQIANRFI